MSLILALDKTWEPHGWMTVQDVMILEAKELVLDHQGESIFLYRGGTNAKSGKQSTLETSSIIIIDGIADTKKRYKAPALTNASLFQRDRFMCAYCGGVFQPRDLTRDHIHPTSKGGKDEWMNVVSACKICNSTKSDTLPGNMLPKDWCGRQIMGPQGNGKMDPIYVPYVPCRAEHLIMKNKSIKLDQMEFLLERVHNKKSRIFKYAEDLFPQMEHA